MSALFSVLLSLNFSPLHAADLPLLTCTELRSKQLCYVWAGGPNGRIIDRKDSVFYLATSTCESTSTSVYETELSIDGQVTAQIYANWNAYHLTLKRFNAPASEPPLDYATYPRTGIWGDYQGFTISTPKANYEVACSSIDP